MPDHAPFVALTVAQLNPYRTLRSELVDDKAHIQQQVPLPEAYVRQNPVLTYPLRTTPMLASALGGAQWSGLYLLLTDSAPQFHVPSGIHIWLLMVLCGVLPAPYLTDVMRAFDPKTRRFRFAREDDTSWQADTLQWYNEAIERHEAAAQWHEASGETPEVAVEYRHYAAQWRNEAARWQQGMAQEREDEETARKTRARRERRTALFTGFLGGAVGGPLLLMFPFLVAHSPSQDWALLFVEYGLGWLTLGWLARTEADPQVPTMRSF